MTTAASLWAVAGIGLSIGGGLYFAATVATLLLVLTLAALKALRKMASKPFHTKEISLSIEKGFSLQLLNEILDRNACHVLFFDIKIEKNIEIVHFAVEDSLSLLKCAAELRALPAVCRIEISE